ncbi:T9SS type A sorting domain-containing protein [Salibacteraceae bacterium]|nr:T9SS type A sorting domain-containing protein [Salibacteraceae bacterium]
MRSLLLALAVGFSMSVNAQTNVAPLAVAAQSGGGVTIYGPANYNDLVIPTYGNTPWGWVYSNGWIEYTWASPVQVEEVIFHNDNRPAATGTIEMWNGSGYTAIATWTNGAVQMHSVTFNKVKTTKLRFNNLTGSNPNFREIEVIEAPDYNNDASLASLLNPSIPVCSQLSDTVEAVILNNGLMPLDSCNVGWMVNDSLMPSAQFLGPIASKSEGSIKLNYFTTLQIGDTIKIWTSAPNGVNDSVPENDTLIYVLIDGLNGVYTIGGSNADFKDIDSAFNTVNAHGICSNVTFELSDGVHMPTVTLNDFYRADRNGVLTITSVSNDRTKAIITDTSFNSGTNYTINLNGANGIVFKEVTISNGSSSTYSGVIRCTGNPYFLEFENCDILNAYSGTSANGTLFLASSNGISDDVSFSNCNFTNGSRAIYMTGDANDGNHNDLRINNCVFLDQAISAIDLELVDNIEIKDNDISSNSNTNNGVAISASSTEGDFEISYNKIIGTSTWPISGIYIDEAAGSQSNIHLLLNNIVSIGDTTANSDFIALAIYESFYWNILHNTLVVQGKSTDSKVIEIVDGIANNVYNNISANFGLGTAMEYDGNGAVFNSEGNCFYTMGQNLGLDQGAVQFDIQSWINNTGFDQKGTVSADPLFIDIYSQNFKLCSPDLDNVGVVVNLSVDIDGVSRNTKAPDPGAHEFSSPAGYAVGDQVICLGDSANVVMAAAANDIIIWNNVDTSLSWGSNMAGSYTSQIIGECGTSIDTFEVIINKFVELANDTNICAGLTFDITANINKGTYKWNDNSTGQTITVTEAGQYFIEVLDSSNCTSMDTIEVTYSTAAMLREDTTVCEGNSVELDPGTPGGNYVWSNGSTSSKLFVDSTFTYSVEYTDAFNCVSRDTTHVEVLPNPFASFTQSNFSQSNWEFIADDTTGYRYEWSFGDGRSDTGRIWKTVNIYASNGTYNVTLVVHSQHCGSATVSQEIDVSTISVGELNNLNVISIYPNPTSGVVNFNWNNSINHQIVSVKLVDINGKIVLDEKINSGTASMDLTAHDVAKGLYTVVISSQDELLYIGKISLN